MAINDIPLARVLGSLGLPGPTTIFRALTHLDIDHFYSGYAPQLRGVERLNAVIVM